MGFGDTAKLRQWQRRHGALYISEKVSVDEEQQDQKEDQKEDELQKAQETEKQKRLNMLSLIVQNQENFEEIFKKSHKLSPRNSSYWESQRSVSRKEQPPTITDSN